MARTPEQIAQQSIGQLVFQVCSLQAQVEALIEENEKLKQQQEAKG